MRGLQQQKSQQGESGANENKKKFEGGNVLCAP
jgi:hypothetical protein